MLADCRDAERGGLFLTGKDAEPLLVRPKEAYDGAVPSANSVALANLIRLSRITGDALRYRAHTFNKGLKSFAAGKDKIMVKIAPLLDAGRIRRADFGKGLFFPQTEINFPQICIDIKRLSRCRQRQPGGHGSSPGNSPGSAARSAAGAASG